MNETNILSLGLKREWVTKVWRKLHDVALTICTPHWILLGWTNQEEWDGCDMWYTQGNAEMHVEFQWGNLKERYYSEDLGTDGMIILKWTSGRFLSTWWWTFRFHRMQRLSWIVEEPSACEELCSMEITIKLLNIHMLYNKGNDFLWNPMGLWKFLRK